MPDDLWRAGAGELAAAIRRGDVSSVDVIESHLARMEAMYGQRHRIASVWQEFQEDYPITVAPIMTQPPFVIGYDLQEPGDVLDQMRFEVALNLLGLPAVCVPTGVANGLPQVVEVIGGRYREGLCLEAAQVIEDALGIVTPIDPVMS